MPTRRSPPSWVCSSTRPRMAQAVLPGRARRAPGSAPFRGARLASPVQVVQIKALACTPPPDTGVPLARWSIAELVTAAAGQGLGGGDQPGHGAPPPPRSAHRAWPRTRRSIRPTSQTWMTSPRASWPSRIATTPQRRRSTRPRPALTSTTSSPGRTDTTPSPSRDRPHDPDELTEMPTSARD